MATVAAKFVEALEEIGARYVFGVPSGGWVDYMEAIRKSKDMEFILTTHEGAAGMMADVVGRLTGKPGLCFGTFGPGATNLATGVGEALLDRSPMIAFTDEFPAAMRGRTAQMAIDHQALFQPLTKKTTRLRPDAVKSIIFDAAKVAMTARPGPVHVGLPVGMSAETATEENISFEAPPGPKPADPSLVDQAVQLFSKSQKPVVALGLGAVAAGLRDGIEKLADRFHIPVVLTPMAKGLLPETHPSYAGVLFHALSDQVGETHKDADLVLAVGYDPVEFNYESWIPQAPVISLDTEPADLDRSKYTLAVDVVGDIATSLEAFLKLPAQKKAWDLEALRERRTSMFQALEEPKSAFGPKAALMQLRAALPVNGIMTCDVGAHTHLIGQVWRTPEPGLQIMTNGWSTMGFGIPAAIAAKLVKPMVPVCAVVGDGGFLMTVGELATAIRYNIKIVIVLLTDNDLALIRIKQERKGNPIYGTPVREKGAIGAKSLFGVPVISTKSPGEFRGALQKAFAADGPVIVEAIIDSREYDDVVLKKDKA